MVWQYKYILKQKKEKIDKYSKQYSKRKNNVKL